MSEKEPQAVEPTSEQLDAINCPDRDILVEAGAGTGKTSTSIDRYARLIDDGLDPSRILVFTFTEKAATELRGKVRGLRDTGRTDFSMSSTWIGTFHSICARILRSHPIAAEVDPAFAILDDVQAFRLKQTAYESALTELLRDPDALEAIAPFSPGVLKEGVLASYGKLRSHGEAKPKLPPLPDDRPPVREILADLHQAALGSFDTPRLNRNIKGQLEAMIDGIDRLPADEEPGYDTIREICPPIGSKLIPDVTSMMSRARIRAAEDEFGDDIRAVLDRLLQGYAERYATTKQAHSVLDFEDLQLTTLRLLRDRETIATIYRQQFNEIMVDEFQDTNRLQMELIAALRGEDTTLFTVGDEMQAIYGFRHADVELFRARRDDPDVTVLPLSANFRSAGPVIAAVNEIGQRLTNGVGSYRSPGATGDDVIGTTHRFKHLRVGVDGGSPTGEEVQLLLTEAGTWSEHDLGPLSPAPDTGCGAPKIDSEEPGDEKPPVNRKKSAGQHEAEALNLAHHIREVIDRGEFEPRDVVILFRAKSLMWLYEEALRQVGVKPYVVGGSRFWETREGIDLRSLLAVIANPLDDDALVGALAGPACGLSTDGIWLLASIRSKEHDGSGKLPLWTALTGPGIAELSLSDSDRGRVVKFLDVINRLRADQATTPMGELVENAVTATGYDLVSVLRDRSGASLANLRRVATIASEFEATEGRDLRGLIEWIDASKELDAESAVATEDEGSDVVRLITIHKSKGLQFGMVCVADLGRRRPSDSEPVFWIDRDPADPSAEDLVLGLRLPESGGGNLDLYSWPELKDRTTRDGADEALRLLHVALTRAKHRLVISGAEKLEKPPALTDSCAAMTRMVTAFDLAGEDGATEIQVTAPEVLETTDWTPVPTAIPVKRNLAGVKQAEKLSLGYGLASPESPETDSLPPLARPSAPSRPTVPLSYSALAQYQACPARFFARRVLRLDESDDVTSPVADRGRAAGAETLVMPEEAGDRTPLDPDNHRPEVDRDATQFGSGVHLVLERSAGARIPWSRPTDGTIETTLRECGVDPCGPDDVKRARDMVDGFLESNLGDRIKGERSEIETQLLVRSEGVIIRGFADLLLPDLDPPLILDYKSNRLNGSSPAEKMESYELQRDLYALGVFRATGTTVVETAFVFLEDPANPVIDRFGRERLDQADARIATLVGEISGGRYLGSEGAEHLPCGNCWACDLLDSRIEQTRASDG